MTTHYVDKYLLNPTHPVSVTLVGCGGTGSQMLTCLARMHVALQGLGHPGFFVTAYDPDIITKANMGRQLFASADVGLPKAPVLITRINRFFGLDWESRQMKYNRRLFESDESPSTNLIISCVDTAKARIHIDKMWKYLEPPRSHEGYRKALYWLDLGNTQRSGQVVLGTLVNIEQPESESKTTGELPTVAEMFDLTKVKEEDQGPSCSLAEALGRQDLFINSVLAQIGADLLWKMFRDLKLRYHGAFLNLETMKLNPIPI